jgi:hypothetical protein
MVTWEVWCKSSLGFGLFCMDRLRFVEYEEQDVHTSNISWEGN